MDVAFKPHESDKNDLSIMDKNLVYIIMTTQKKGLKRNTIDKYYTREVVAEFCIHKIKKALIIDNNDLVIEPSAGNGSFIKPIKDEYSNYKFYDI